MSSRNTWKIGAVALWLALPACSQTEEPAAEAPPEEQTIDIAEDLPLDIALGNAGLKKLTRSQYVNSLRDVIGEELEVPPTGEPDTESGGLVAVGVALTPYSALGVETFESAAFAIAEQIITGEELRAQHVPCDNEESFQKECAQTTLETMGAKLWRRPLIAEEVTALLTVAEAASEALGDHDQGLVFGLAGLFQSPYFLYRVELGEPVEGEDFRAFTGYELASRLSYFLWNTTPDDTLLAAAKDGLLDTEDGLMAQAERLLNAPRAREGFERFYDEYLKLEEAEGVSKDPLVYENYTEEYGPSAARETRLLLDYLIFDGDRDFRELMTTRTTHLNPLLASLYDLPSPSLDGFTRINLPVESNRAGLLGHASFLAQHSHQVSTSVTRRGEAVRKILLCQSIPSPPVDVDTSIPEPSGEAPTMRDRVAEHLQNPSCAGCHMLTDPIGLGLENYNGVGQFRILDNGALIDPSGDLDNVEFDGPIALGRAIANHPDFSSCLVRTLTRYARGRLELGTEKPAMTALEEGFAESGYRVKALILDLIRSPLFRRAGGTQ